MTKFVCLFVILVVIETCYGLNCYDCGTNNVCDDNISKIYKKDCDQNKNDLNTNHQRFCSKRVSKGFALNCYDCGTNTECIEDVSKMPQNNCDRAGPPPTNHQRFCSKRIVHSNNKIIRKCHIAKVNENEGCSKQPEGDMLCLCKSELCNGAGQIYSSFSAVFGVAILYLVNKFYVL